MFDLHQHQHNTNIICGTYPIIAECEKEYNQMANLKNKLDEYFKSLKIKAKVNVDVIKVTKTFTVACIEIEFNGDKWGWKHRSLNKEVKT